mmetsp:Transcript_54405/g.158042  ORF Transcript_54405/g.158042 Transcript_54405/m.158042 type:complete len:183 (+) Transcript_54405:139-687(+)
MSSRLLRQACAASARHRFGCRPQARASASTAGVACDAAGDPAPTPKQLRAHALQSGVPMVGFGIVDCVVMTQVGSTIDTVLGASLGISAMTAAAIGLFFSDSCGVLFGGTIESFASRLGLPRSELTIQQLESAKAKRWATLGRLFGVQLGVILGSVSLLLRPSDANKAKPSSMPADHLGQAP